MWSLVSISNPDISTDWVDGTIIIQAGAGPTGLLLALTLLKNGVQVRVVDKDPNRHPGQRGSGIQVSIVTPRDS